MFFVIPKKNACEGGEGPHHCGKAPHPFREILLLCVRPKVCVPVGFPACVCAFVFVSECVCFLS